MKKILIFLLLLSNFVQSQVTIHVPQEVQGTIGVYSYYPQNTNNQPVTYATLVDGNAVVETNGLKNGFYSLYYSQDGSLEKAPYIDVFIDTNEREFSVYWNPFSGFSHFVNAPRNASLKQLYKNLNDWQQQEQEWSLMQKSITDVEWQTQCNQYLDSIALKKNTLSQHIKHNNFNEDDYLAAIIDLKLNKFNSNDFWQNVVLNREEFWATPYQNVVFNEWAKLCNETTVDEDKRQVAYIEGIIQNLGKNKKLHPFLLDWIHQNFDYNQTNDSFLLAMKTMLQLPNLDVLLKSTWDSKYKNYQTIQSGTEINLSEIDKTMLTDNDTDIFLVLYSESCGSCKDVLTQLNASDKKVIAVRIKAAETESLFKETDFPNILFHKPTNVNFFKSFAPRGTPTLLHLNRAKSLWKIKNVF